MWNSIHVLQRAWILCVALEVQTALWVIILTQSLHVIFLAVSGVKIRERCGTGSQVDIEPSQLHQSSKHVAEIILFNSFSSANARTVEERYVNILFNIYQRLQKVSYGGYVKILHIHLYFTKPGSTCGIYSQLSSILKPSNHILKSSKVIFNGTVVKKCAVLAAI